MQRNRPKIKIPLTRLDILLEVASIVSLLVYMSCLLSWQSFPIYLIILWQSLKIMLNFNIKMLLG